MKILAVVTLVSPLGEYGGPLRVAVNQAKALITRGHSVTISGAFLGEGRPLLEVDGVPARLFRARNVIPNSGHAGLAAPGLWNWIMGSGKEYDIVHIHLARDLVSMPTALIVKLRGLRYVVQTHGMIDESDRMMSKPLDLIMTRSVLTGAQSVLYLTANERDDLIAVAAGRPLTLNEMPNGVPTTEIRVGCSLVGPEVLFLGRLAHRKRPLAFVAMAETLSAEFPMVRFSLVGPDAGEGLAVRDAVDAARARGVSITWEGSIPPSASIQRMSEAAIFVLPAKDEPYPMSVLEAMSVGLPVVVTDSCGLAPFVESAGGGLVVGQDQESLVEAVRKLLSNALVSRTVGDRARNAVRTQKNMDLIAANLERLYLP